MTSQTTMTAPDRARVLRGWFESQGFELNQPSILQPAGVFVDLSGEDIRRRLYTVSDPEGRELCLRPDFTIPVARAYLEAGAPAERRFCYSGTAFRYRRGDAVDEFEQAGIEIFGAGDARGAEREILRLALRSVMAEGLTRITLRAGDIGLFETLLAALELPDYWHRRIRRHFWRHDLVESLNAELARPRESAGEAMAAALEGLDRDAASDMVEEVLALAGIVPVGGRSAEEIAQRFMERASSGAETLTETAVALIQDYLAIAGEPEPALEQLDALMRSSGLSLSKEITALRERLEDMVEIAREAELPPEAIRFEAGFGRNMEYYTGLVFEICHADRPELRQIASGGRYDDLLSDLGAPSTIPAVGCGLYVDRLIAALRDAKP